MADSTYISAREVYTTIAPKSTILAWERLGLWPRGIRLSAKVTVWRRAEVDARIAEIAAEQIELIDQRQRVGQRLVEGRRAKRLAAEQRRREASEARAA